MIINFIKNNPFVKYFLDIRKELALIRFQTTTQTRILQQLYKEQITEYKREKSFPSQYEHQTFSQNGEDGIIIEIFRRLNISAGYFIEMGSGDGSENNTRLLLELGWSGIWIDGDKANIDICEKNFQKFIDSNRLIAQKTFICDKNVNSVLSELNIPADIEFLSIDLDLTTHLVWEKVGLIKPKVVAIEYNGFFPDLSHWKADLDKNKMWDGSINMGASLHTITEISNTKGYQLIGCDLTGTNAFFVLEEIASKYFPNIDSNLYEPARPFLNNDAGHRR